MSSRKVLKRAGEDIMHRRGQKTTFQERIVISELAEVGHTDPEIAAYVGCSVWTVRKTCGVSISGVSFGSSQPGKKAAQRS